MRLGAPLFKDITAAEIQARIAACHADVLRLYAYWQSKCRPGIVAPRRSDIDPIDIFPLLGNILIVDVVPDDRRFVYRLVGTRDVACRGFDPTGKSVVEAWFGGSLEETLSCYDYVVRQAGPFCYRDPYLAPDGETEQEDIIYLPLSEDGSTVTGILVFSRSITVHRRDAGSRF
jgi:hypothetical protein